jgi:hypothetical protein
MTYYCKESKEIGEYDIYVDVDIYGGKNSWITTIYGKERAEDFVKRMNQ